MGMLNFIILMWIIILDTHLISIFLSSIWKEREKYSFPSLSIYFFFPWKKWENTHFSMGKMGLAPPTMGMLKFIILMWIIILDTHLISIFLSSIWKEREKYSFPSLSVYFFPMEKMGKHTFFHGQNGVAPPPPPPPPPISILLQNAWFVLYAHVYVLYCIIGTSSKTRTSRHCCYLARYKVYQDTVGRHGFSETSKAANKS